jgi:hypothetical protein
VAGIGGPGDDRRGAVGELRSFNLFSEQLEFYNDEPARLAK